MDRSASRRSPSDFAAHLYAIPRRHEEGRAQGRHRSPSSTRTPTTAPRSATPSSSEAKKAQLDGGDRSIPYNAKLDRRLRAGACSSRKSSRTVVIFISYTADAILYMKTMKNLDYLPPMIIGDDAGFSDPSFIPAVGDIAQGVMNRSAWDDRQARQLDDLQDQRPLQGQDRPRSGRHQRRATCRRFFVLADAINRAGSTDPDKIQEALRRDRSQAQSAHDGLSRRQVRRDRPERPGRDVSDPAQGQGLRLGLARQIRHRARVWPMKGWK